MRTACLIPIVLPCCLPGCGDENLSGSQAAGQMDAADTPLARPEAAVEAYLDAMRRREAHADLPMLSSDSRALMKSWNVRPQQMAAMVSAYQACNAEPALIDPEGALAVVRYPRDEHNCSPWFLIREGEEWRLDLAAGQRIIRFGRDNAWRFDTAQLAQSPFAFAFSDWEFDGNGRPR